MTNGHARRNWMIGGIVAIAAIAVMIWHGRRPKPEPLAPPKVDQLTRFQAQMVKVIESRYDSLERRYKAVIDSAKLQTDSLAKLRAALDTLKADRAHWHKAVNTAVDNGTIGSKLAATSAGNPFGGDVPVPKKLPTDTTPTPSQTPSRNPTDLTDPTVPPKPGPTDSKTHADEAQAIQAAAAIACLVQPEVCPIMLALANLFGGLSNEDQREVMNIVQGVARDIMTTGQVSPGSMERAMKFAAKNPKVGDAAKQVIDQMTPGLPPLADTLLRKQIPPISIPDLGSEVLQKALGPMGEAVIKAVREGKSCSEILGNFSGSARWATRQQRDAVKALVGSTPRWRECLDTLPVAS